MDTEFQFCKIKRILKIGSTTVQVDRCSLTHEESHGAKAITNGNCSQSECIEYA